MKRKNKSRNRIGYQQLENRWLLAAIANGQEIESSISAGTSETFEFDVESPGAVRVGVILSQSSGEPMLEIFDPSGALVHSSSAPEFADATFAAFDATSAGQYTAVVQEVDNDDFMEFRIRVAAFANSTFDIPASLQSVSFGEQLDLEAPTFDSGTFSVFRFDTTQESTIAILANAYQVGSNFTPETLVEVFDSNGNLVAEGTRDGLNLATFTATASETYSILFRATDFDSSLGTARVLSLPGTSELVPDQDFVLRNGQEYLPTLSSTGIGLFPFEATEQGTGIFSVDRVAIGGFVDEILVLAPDGSVVATEDLTDAFELEFDIEQLGLYTVAVAEQNFSSFTYRARALFFPGDPQLVDGQDLLLDENPAASVILQTDGTAVFPIEAPSDGQLSFSVDASTFNFNYFPTVAIYDQDGNRVALNSGRSGTSVLVDVEAGQPYHAVVFGAFQETIVNATILTSENGLLQSLANGEEALVAVIRPLNSENSFAFSIEAEQDQPLVISLGTPNDLSQQKDKTAVGHCPYRDPI